MCVTHEFQLLTSGILNLRFPHLSNIAQVHVSESFSDVDMSIKCASTIFLLSSVLFLDPVRSRCDCCLWIFGLQTFHSYLLGPSVFAYISFIFPSRPNSNKPWSGVTSQYCPRTNTAQWPFPTLSPHVLRNSIPSAPRCVYSRDSWSSPTMQRELIRPWSNWWRKCPCDCLSHDPKSTLFAAKRSLNFSPKICIMSSSCR